MGRWCEFYTDDLLPQTRAMVKRTSAKLDSFGLFLPSRMGASVAPELIQKGLRMENPSDDLQVAGGGPTTDDQQKKQQLSEERDAALDQTTTDGKTAATPSDNPTVEEDEEEDEDEYEEEEYYDDEDIE